jgi:hypothetical protein
VSKKDTSKNHFVTVYIRLENFEFATSQTFQGFVRLEELNIYHIKKVNCENIYHIKEVNCEDIYHIKEVICENMFRTGIMDVKLLI